MELLNNLALGFGVAFTFQNLSYAFFGAVLGTLIGAERQYRQRTAGLRTNALPGDKSQAEVGDSVRYTITVSVPSGALPRQTTVVDRLPAGFRFEETL